MAPAVNGLKSSPGILDLTRGDVFKGNFKLKYFRNYSLQKTWLGECIAGPVSEDPSAVNVLTCPKHCRSLQESIFILFYHSDIDRAVKSPS